MAAYNSGPGTVQRAVQRTGYADFWELYRRNVLPEETRNYVPIILAMTIMAKNPSQYGLDHLPLDSPAASDTVRIHYPIDLRLVAECTDSSTAVLQELNPSLLRMTTPKDMDFDLHLPPGTADKFKKTVEAIPEEMRVYWRYHRVESGETLSEIARRYHTTASSIAEANNLQEDELAQDSRLIIPVSPAKPTASSEGESNASVRYGKQATHYKVHRGDTVQSVADEFGISAEKVRQWNHLKGNTLPAGRALTIFKPASEAARKQSDSSGSRRRGRPAHAGPQRDALPPARGAKVKDIEKGSARGKSGDRAASAERKEKVSDAGAVPAKKKKHHQQG
jgi:membrane-bound lytic murein transglycosylase D